MKHTKTTVMTKNGVLSSSRLNPLFSTTKTSRRYGITRNERLYRKTGLMSMKREPTKITSASLKFRKPRRRKGSPRRITWVVRFSPKSPSKKVSGRTSRMTKPVRKKLFLRSRPNSGEVPALIFFSPDRQDIPEHKFYFWIGHITRNLLHYKTKSNNTRGKKGNQNGIDHPRGIHFFIRGNRFVD